MVARWNEAVWLEDEVWHLGDLAIRQTQARVAELLAQLRGRKQSGDQQQSHAETIELAAWSSVQAYAELTAHVRRIMLCHYAFRTWRDMGRHSINLHGHSHGRLKPQPRQFDVGVDVWDFRPVTLEEILEAKSS